MRQKILDKLTKSSWFRRFLSRYETLDASTDCVVATSLSFVPSTILCVIHNLFFLVSFYIVFIKSPTKKKGCIPNERVVFIKREKNDTLVIKR